MIESEDITLRDIFAMAALMPERIMAMFASNTLAPRATYPREVRRSQVRTGCETIGPIPRSNYADRFFAQSMQ